MLINCNYRIFRDGFKSFVVWYKIIHTFIACIAECIIDKYTYPTNKHNINDNEYGILDAYLNSTYVINILLLIAIVSLLDGYPSGTSNGNQKSTLIQNCAFATIKSFKYIGIAVGI